MNKEGSLHAKYMNRTVQGNDKSMNKYFYSIVYRLYFIVIINRAFYIAIFNVLLNSSFIKQDHNIIKHSFLLSDIFDNIYFCLITGNFISKHNMQNEQKCILVYLHTH